MRPGDATVQVSRDDRPYVTDPGAPAVPDLDPAADVLATPAPVLDAATVTRVVRDGWGLDVRDVRRLASERDANVLLDGRYVLKVSNPAEDAGFVDLEDVAMAHVRRVDPGLPVPDLVRTPAGAVLVEVEDDTGRACLARLITVVPGAPAEGRPVTADLAEQIGRLTARTATALHGLFHPRSDRVLDWDVRRAPAVLTPEVLDALGENGSRLAAVLPRITAAVASTAVLPSGLAHADVTLTNVLVGSDPARADGPDVVTGLIDFGDMHHTAYVCDLAATLTSVLRNTAAEQPAGTWELAGAVLRGYQRARPLSPAEVDVLGDLVVARLALTLAISARREVDHEDDRAYVAQYDASTVRVLAGLLDLGGDEVTRRLHALAGTGHLRTPADDSALLDRRRRLTGGPLSPLFYARPLHVVRGEGPWLVAADGTRYLDAYNNVAVVGHAHPVVAQAVGRQLAELNTHSRYLHHALVELGERILATMPAGLDTVLFTTSGTEANELAWRLATAATGGTGAVIAEHAYHGSSKWLADLSSNEWPAGYRPAHVATFAAPRASTGDVDGATAAARVAAAADALRADGDRPALVLADLGFTSEGIHDAPDDFVAGLVRGAHDAGALFLADEVQAGYGRVGPAFWRFAVAGVTPDLVTLGKPMGAGYPVAALVTRREIADTLARDYEFFSTFAGSPAAAAAGLAVLDVLRDEALPERAVVVGDHLRSRLASLAAADDRLGEVRGRGLIAGVDVVGPPGADRTARRTFARTLLDALRDRRILAGLTGPEGTVLKIRPPLVWRTGHADLFVETLGDVLREDLR